MYFQKKKKEFRERNAVVAQKWAALSEDTRKEWALKAEAACSAAIQVSAFLFTCVCVLWDGMAKTFCSLVAAGIESHPYKASLF